MSKAAKLQRPATLNFGENKMKPYRDALDELQAAKDASRRAEMTNKVYRLEDYAPRIKAAQAMVDMLTIDLTGMDLKDACDLVTPFLETANGYEDLIDTGHVYLQGDLIDWIGAIMEHPGGREAHIALCDDISEAVKFLPLGSDYCDLVYSRENGNHALFGFNGGDREFKGEARTLPCAILIAVLKYKITARDRGREGSH